MIIVNINPEETYARAAGLWQYDYGQVLRIQGLSLPPAIEIHFSLQETGGEAITRIGVTKDGVTNVVIPDSILEGAGAIDDYFAYAFIYPSDDSSGQTEYRIEISVKSRPKPEGYKGSGDDTMGAIMKAVNEIAAGKADGLEYKNSILRLMSGETELAQVTISGGSGGENGITPHIGENGNWYLGEADTGVKASGSDGITPHIGDNGNWYIGETDTGVKAEAPSTDSTLTESGKAADAKITGEKISELKSEIEALKNGETGTETPGGASWTTTQIDNLESVLYMMEFSTEALAAEGKTKIDALITSLRNGTSSGSGGSSGGGESGGGTEITLTSISAVYNGGEVQEGTSASDLDITVTANYSDGSSAVVSGWSISGTVAIGTNTFTITYNNKTTTITVTGIESQKTDIKGNVIFTNYYMFKNKDYSFYQLYSASDRNVYIIPITANTQYKIVWDLDNQYRNPSVASTNYSSVISDTKASVWLLCTTSDMSDATTGKTTATFVSPIELTDLYQKQLGSDGIYHTSCTITFDSDGYFAFDEAAGVPIHIYAL